MSPRKPAASSPPPSLVPSSLPSPSWPQALASIVAGLVSLSLALGILIWLPTCLEFIRLPQGGVSHDLWAWAPFVLDLASAVAVAAPTSFGRLLAAARVLRGG